MPPRPYRTQWRTVDSEQLQAMSLVDGRTEDPYLPYEEERTRITEWRNKKAHPPAPLLARWAFHPDERVRAELVRCGKIYAWFGIASYPQRPLSSGELGAAFLDRTLEEMHAEGVYWTPLLDEIVRFDRTVGMSLVQNTIKTFTSWLQTQANQDNLREILRDFRAITIHRIVLKHAGCIDLAFAREIYEHVANRYFINALAENPAVSDNIIKTITQWLVEDWEARIRGTPAIREDSWICLANLLLKRPPAVPSDALRRVYALHELTHGSNVRTATQRDHRGATPSEAALSELESFSKAIVNERLFVSPDVLCAAIPFIRKDENILRNLLANHPSTDVAVWREALKHTQVWGLHETAAEKPQLCQDPEIGQCLLRSRNPRVLSLLVRNADPQVAAAAMRRLIGRGDLKNAAKALAVRAPENPIELEPADLVPLLQSNDRDTRLVAISCLGRLQNQTQPTTTDHETSRSTKTQTRHTTR